MKHRFKGIWLIVLLYVCYIGYFIIDMQTSASTNVKQTGSRTGAHVFLFLTIALLSLYFVLNMCKHKPSVTCVCMYLLGVWGCVIDFARGANIWSFAVHVGLIILWAGTLYFFETYIDTPEKLKCVIILEIVVFAIAVYFAFVALNNFDEFRGDNATVVLNMAYVLLPFFPILICNVKNTFLNAIILTFICVYTVVSLKRGAIIMLVVMLMVWFKNKYIDHKIVSGEKRTTIRYSGFAFLVLVAIVLIIFPSLEISQTLFSRFSLEELVYGSNRDRLYSTAINNILHFNFSSFMFGRGSEGTAIEIGGGIHNDYLEVQYLYGLIGTIIYSYFIISMFMNMNYYKKNSHDHLAQYAMCVCYLLIVGMFSAAVFSLSTFHIFAALGLNKSLVNLNLPVKGEIRHE